MGKGKRRTHASVYVCVCVSVPVAQFWLRNSSPIYENEPAAPSNLELNVVKLYTSKQNK